ncbi:Mu homology domain-containing protein [Hyaloraphidium curvatum]|nr:Mu homology domain-containing protein [Hyaloraphidium curvatum]
MIGAICVVGADSGKVLVEKAWRGRAQTGRTSWADDFIEAAKQHQLRTSTPAQLGTAQTPGQEAPEPSWTGIPSSAVSIKVPGLTDALVPSELLPVLVTPRGYIHQLWDARARLWWLGICYEETPPLAVVYLLRFVQRLASEYYGSTASGHPTLSEQLVRDNAAGILQLVEETLDDGRPVWTEEAVLRDAIPPPTILSNIVQALGGPVTFNNASVGRPAVPTASTLSSIPWRSTGIRHMNNELFLDVVEDMDVLIDAKSGGLLVGEIRGMIRCDCRLSGMPDIVLAFQPSGMKNLDPDMVSLHPSVRLNRWQRDRILSFVPPDGTFTLCSYSLPLPSSSPLPVHVRPSVAIHKNRGKLEISVQPSRSGVNVVENLVLVATLPASAGEVKVETSQGKAVWDVIGKRLHWSIGRLSREAVEKTGIPVLSAGFSISGEDPTASQTTCHSVHAEFRVQGWCPSGIRVDSLQVLNEGGYKAYKGVRFLTRAGKYCTR